MARIPAVVTGTVIDSVTFGNALRNDYVSQTDANAQEIASAVNFTSATVTKSGTALATTTNVSDHAALTTGVHGVGAGTIAKTGDITDANLTCTDVATNNSSTTKHGFLKKLDDDTTHFMRGDGSWAVPAGASGADGEYAYLITLNGADAEAYNRSGALVYGGAGDEGAVNGATHEAVIQAAINNDPNVYILDGTYTLNASLVLVSNLILRGESYTGTILKLKNSATDDADHANVLYSNADISNVTLKNFQVDCNKDNNSGLTVAHTGYGLYVRSQIQHCLIENVYIHDARQTGVYIRAGAAKETFDVRVQNCQVTHNGYNDITFSVYDNTGHIHDCTAAYCYTGNSGDISLDTYAVDSSGSAYLKLHDIYFLYNTVAEMNDTDGSSQAPYAWFGIRFEDSYRCRAIGNSILGATAGVYDDSNGGGEHIVEHNTITLKDLSEGAAKLVGIEFYSALGSNRITNNTILGPATLTHDWTGIQLDNDHNRVVGNDIFDYGGSGTIIGIHENSAATQNVFRDNRVYGCDTEYVYEGTEFVRSGNSST